MADTTNYEWSKPTVGGDTGAWGTILNALFDSIDEDLFASEGTADEALAENLEQPLIGVQGGAGEGWTIGLSANANLTDTVGAFVLPLPQLRSGQQIVAFLSYGNAFSGAAAVVKLCFGDIAGAETVVSAGHSLPGDFAPIETTGLTHDVDINRRYYIKVEPSGVAGFVNLIHVQLTVTRP